MKSDFSKELKLFIKDTCAILGIKKPTIRIVDIVPGGSHASYNPASDTIYILDGFIDSDFYEVCMFVAHELRHKWQIKQGVFGFDDYMQKGTSDFYDYNMQEAELDANAFGAYMVEIMFDVEVKFERIFPKDICDELYDRLDDFYND